MRAAVPAAALLLAAGCDGPSTHDIRVTILDPDGSPIPGAVFYAEVYDDEGAFAFLTARAGDAGEVPDSAREALLIPWRRGARIALAAFAPGYHPNVRRDPAGRVRSDGAVLVLTPISENPESPGPRLTALDFPFVDDPEMSARAAAPEDEELRTAFRAGYEALLASGDSLSAVEISKIRALGVLE